MMSGWLQAGGLTFDKDLIELNLAPDGISAVAEFSFENKSDKPVTIARIDKSCSCLEAQVQGGKTNYRPGEKGVVRVNFAVGNFAGQVDKSIVLWIDKDAADKPSVTLTVRAHVPVLVEMDQKTLKWTVGDKPEPQRIDIRMKHSKPIRVLKATSSSELFKLELKELKAGEHYELWVTPLEIAKPGIAVIRMQTDCDISRHQVQQAFAVVRRDLPGEGAAKP